MNILILADLVTFSGVGNYIRYLTTSLVERGNKVVIATAQDDLHIEGVKTFLLRPINVNPIIILFNISFLHSIIKEYSIDIIHTNHRMSSFLVGVYNFFYPHIPMVWTSHSGAFPMNFIKKIMGYYGEKNIAISSDSERFMLDVLKISEKSIMKVYNGVDDKNLFKLSDFESLNLKKKWNIPLNKITFVVHGRIAHAKGIDFLIDTIGDLDKKYKDRIVIVCSGSIENNLYYEEIKRLIIEKNLQDIFIFVGWCNSREILGIADLMLQPSRREGFPLADVEAFFMELPVIRTMVGGFEDMRDICIGIPFGDKEAFLFQIKSFIDNPLQFSDMVQKAKVKALEQFTLETMVTKTYEVYLSAIKSVNNK